MTRHDLHLSRLLCFLLFASTLSAVAADSSAATNSITPLVRAHSHNDYEHRRPLQDALDAGFCSVEADIHLVDGELLVAHDRPQAKPGRTLQNLYLNPLRDRIQASGGRVYPNGPSVTLLIDVKSEANQTYAALRTVLREYADILTSYHQGVVRTNAVTVIISGNRPREMLSGETERFAAMDGRLPDLGGKVPVTLIPLVSDSWAARFKWRGVGPFSPGERSQLHELVANTHAEGRRIRFWATPDNPGFWTELVAAGVDHISVDDLAGLRRFLVDERVIRGPGP